MQYIKWLSHYKDSRESAVTFGKFDGLHKGHQKLVEKVSELAKQEGLNSIVCSFDMHPLWEKKGGVPQVLMSSAERQEHLKDKVDYLVECPFTEEFSQMHAEKFIKDIIKELFHAKYVVVGTDFRFGYQKQGDIQMLKVYAGIYGYQLIVIDKERYEDRVISSTYIREVLSQGEAGLAAKLLGYAYGLSGVVEHGKQLGRTLGFPTFNVAWPQDKIVPPRGVYLSNVLVDGCWYHGISNVGVKPTVSDEQKVLIESFLFGYEGEAYGKTVSIELLEFRRPEQKFKSIEEMKACIDNDIAYGKHFFGCEK